MNEYEKRDGDYGDSGTEGGQGSYNNNSGEGAQENNYNNSNEENTTSAGDAGTDSSANNSYNNSYSGADNNTNSSANNSYYNSGSNSYYNSSDNDAGNNFYDSSDSDANNSYYNSGNNSYYNNTGSGSNNYYNNSQGFDNNKKPKKNKKIPTVAIVVIIVAVILVVALVATVVTTYNTIQDSDLGLSDGGTQKTYDDIGTTEIETDDTKDTDSTDDSTSTGGVTITDVSDIVKATIPSVVAITSTEVVESGYSYYDDIYSWYFGGDSNNTQTYEEQSAGSGIIVDQTNTELLILTNNHVIADADGIKVQFYGQSGDETVEANVKGTDANMDVAVVAVQLDDIPGDVLSSIKKSVLGDSDAVEVGDGVIAIGNALGEGQSVTTGIISAKDKEATIEDVTLTLLQTDAAINGGNSGGALINADGEVIGINVAKYSSGGDSTNASIEGMGFAIPISSVKEIIADLETKDTKTKVDEDEQGYLGITGFDVSEEDAAQYSMPEGVYVYSVSEGGPADEAGIEASDIIVGFDGQTVTTMTELQSLMEYYAVGDEVEVTIAYKDGKEYKEKDVTVTLGDESATEGLESSEASKGEE